MRVGFQVVRLTKLIDEILDLSRLEENKLELHKELFSLNNLMNETEQDIMQTTLNHTIKVFHDFDCAVFGDKDRIGRVIINFYYQRY